MAGSRTDGFCRRDVLVLLALAMVVMGLLQLRVPYLSEMASHAIDAARIWRGDIDCSAVYRLPLGYAGYLSPFIATLGEPLGVKIANLTAFAGLLVAALAFLAEARQREALPNGPAVAYFGLLPAQLGAAVLTLALTLYPYMIFDVARTTEAVPAAALLVAFLWSMFKRPTLTLALFAGACLGFGMHVRANMLSLLLPAVLWIYLREPAWGRRCLLALGGLVALGVSYGSASLLFTGCGWYSPTNGAYNFYAGNNPLSSAYLATDQNAEYSIIPSLRDRGVVLEDVPDAYEVPQASYMAWVRRYASECPSCVVSLALQKTVVFFSPRLKNATGILEISLQVAMCVLTLFTLTVLVWRFVRRRRYGEGIVLVIFAAYALPFLVTNADPRLRFPLDIVALCYLGLLFADWLNARWKPGSAKVGI